MTEKYHMHSTSRQSATLEDVVLKHTSTTRLLLRPLIVDNPNNAEAGVKITFVHQRKNKADEWEDLPGPPLSSLKAGDLAKLALDSETTLALLNELKNLYAIRKTAGVKLGETELVVGREDEIIRADPDRARLIKKLLTQGHGYEVWKTLTESDPDLATRLSIARIHAERESALAEFRSALEQNKQEAYWQDFFQRNTWIFGYGLNYQILKPVQSQPSYGGRNVAGRGEQRGDFLQRTEGVARFTVLVEIKRPDTLLLGKQQYRNGAWELGAELVGAVSQMQANCRKWELEGARSEENAESLAAQRISTIQPKGILVIGHTGQLSSSPKKTTFEMFRQNLVKPEIITFDELLARAEFIVKQTGADEDAPQDAEVSDDSVPPDDDVPF